MNGLQLSGSLRAFSRLTGDLALDPLANAFAEGGAETTSKIVAKISKYWKAMGRADAHPFVLRERLEAIKFALEDSAAPSSAKDYSALLTLFVGPGNQDSAMFASELHLAIITPIPQKPKAAKAPKVDASQLADRLTTLISSNAAFDAEVAAIEINAKIKKADLQKVANQFLGYERDFKNRGEIIKAIRTRQLQDAIQGSRDRRGEKIAV